MAKFKNTYAGKLTIPGAEKPVKPEGEIELNEKQLKIESVKSLIKSELLVPVGKQAKKTKKREGLEAQATGLDVSFDDSTTDEQLIEAIKTAKAAK